MADTTWMGLSQPTSGTANLHELVSADNEIIDNGFRVKLTLASNFSAGEVCYVDGSGEAELADKSAENSSYVEGVCIEDGLAGSDRYFVSHGVVEVAGWGLTPGDFYFLDTSGGITNSRPVTGYVVEIGRAYSATVMFVRIKVYLTSISGGQHDTLANLAWSVAGHTMDTDLAMLTNSITGVNDIQVTSISERVADAGVTISDTLYIANGGIIRCTGAPVMTFNDTNDFWSVTGCAGYGFGTASPSQRVHIQGNSSSSISQLIENQNTTGDVSLLFSSASLYQWGMGIDKSDNGALKIGASYTLGTNSVFVADYTSKHIVLGGSNNVSSDYMLKVKGETSDDTKGVLILVDLSDGVLFSARNDGQVKIHGGVLTLNDNTIDSSTTDNYTVNSGDNTIESGLATCTIGGGGNSSFPNLIGSTGKPAGTGFTPIDWDNDSSYVAESASVATICGGYDHVNNQIAGTICGGGHNFIKYNLDGHSFIGGGSYNLISGARAVICGGQANTVTGGTFGAILGGNDNNATGRCAVILGGEDNDINGDYAIGYGRRAKGTDDGTLTFCDSTDADFTNSTADSVAMRYSGGYYFSGGNVKFDGDLEINSTSPKITLTDTNGTDLQIYTDANSSIFDSYNTIQFRRAGTNTIHIETTGDLDMNGKNITNALAVYTDTMTEYTADNGIDIESVNIKDGDIHIADANYIYFGDSDDATIGYDGVDLIINPDAVGSGEVRINGQLDINGLLDTNGMTFGTKSLIQLSGGVVTATQVHHEVAPEGMGADDCDTINGYAEGKILIVCGAVANITFKNGTGNLTLNGDFISSGDTMYLTLIGTGSGWTELSRTA